MAARPDRRRADVMASHWSLGALAVLGTLATAPLAGDAGPPDRSPMAVRPGAELPAVMTRHYRMSGHVRPLLAFWISRDDVGDGRLVWRKGPGGRVGWDFVLGTDPARAPRGLNRWGYIAEENSGSTGTLLAVMSRSPEDSLGEVRAGDDRTATRGEFQAIRASIDNGVCRAQISIVHTATVLTIHDVDALVEQASAGLENAALKTTALGPDVRPGFLAAVAELVDASVASRRGGATGGRAMPTTPIPYVFGERQFEVALTSERGIDEFKDGEARYRGVVQGKFEIVTLANGDRTRFELVYGVDGDLAGVPLQITYQPKWWLKVVLHLEN
jgi:hypothetical protein